MKRAVGLAVCLLGCGGRVPLRRSEGTRAAALRARAAEIARPVLSQAAERAVGVAVIDGDDDWVFGFGPRSATDPRPLDGVTTFEIGSIAKVFAGVLLADSVARGEVALADPAARHLPADLPISPRVTLLDLATHTAGLPFMPSNWVRLDPATHRTRYTRELFTAFLRELTLATAPGERYAYSNVGTALLAHALAARAGVDYHELLERRLLAPLGMRRSGYVDREARLDDNALDGYADDGTRAPWRVDVSPVGPCCAVRSTLDDMVRFARAALRAAPPLGAAFAVAAEPRVRMEGGGYEWSALGWQLRTRQGLLWKNGQVAGYRCVLVLWPETQRALFVVVNSEAVDIDTLAADLVDALLAPPVRSPRSRHAALAVGALPTGARAAAVTFGDRIRLEGWQAPAEVAPGEVVRVTLFHRCLRPVGGDYQLFVHGDGAGAPRLHADHYPGGGADSTAWWQPGELVRDDFEVTVPPDYAGAAFTLWLGFYRGSQRLPASGDLEIHDDRVAGPTITVRRR